MECNKGLCYIFPLSLADMFQFDLPMFFSGGALPPSSISMHLNMAVPLFCLV